MIKIDGKNFIITKSVLEDWIIIQNGYQHYIGPSETGIGSLKQGFVFEPCGWKNVVRRRNPTKGGQPSSPAEISHRQSGGYFAPITW